MAPHYSNNSSPSGGGDFLTLLLMAFIILKLTHVIDWSWWWVLSPFWIPLGIWLIVLAVSLPAIIKRRKRRKELEKWKFR